MKRIFFFALTTLLFLTSCKKNDEDQSQRNVLNETFELDYREIKTFEDSTPNFSITFENLIEDSRCPVDVICDWEGRAVVEIIIEELEVKSIYQLTTYYSINPDSLETIQHNNYIIKLIEVNPIPVTTNQVEIEDYSIELEIIEE